MIYVIDNDLLVFFKKHNVIIEKLDVIRNFMITLFFVLEETYVGREFLVTTDDCYKHFKYGFARTKKILEKRGIVFKNDFFCETAWVLFNECFYNESKINLYDYINRIFKPNRKYTRLELVLLINMYQIFEREMLKDYKYGY
jgi:hypothetical protein